MSSRADQSIERQMAAWKRYAEASRKAQASLSFEDGREAAQAWVGFLNSYLPDDGQMPERRLGPNVSIFPVHRTRAHNTSSGPGAEQ